MVKGMKFLPKMIRNPDGTVSWRVVASMTYALSVWSIIGAGVIAYKFGYVELTEKKDPTDSTVSIDWQERARIVAEDVAENIYTTADFMG